MRRRTVPPVKRREKGTGTNRQREQDDGTTGRTTHSDLNIFLQQMGLFLLSSSLLFSPPPSHSHSLISINTFFAKLSSVRRDNCRRYVVTHKMLENTESINLDFSANLLDGATYETPLIAEPTKECPWPALNDSQRFADGSSLRYDRLNSRIERIGADGNIVDTYRTADIIGADLEVEESGSTGGTGQTVINIYRYEQLNDSSYLCDCYASSSGSGSSGEDEPHFDSIHDNVSPDDSRCEKKSLVGRRRAHVRLFLPSSEDFAVPRSIVRSLRFVSVMKR